MPANWSGLEISRYSAVKPAALLGGEGRREASFASD
jgi:hypothetical protein